MQLRIAVDQLVAAARALPPLLMEGVGAAARLALPQIGCSNPECAKGPAPAAISIPERMLYHMTSLQTLAAKM